MTLKGFEGYNDGLREGRRQTLAEIKEKIIVLKQWIDEQHIHFDGKKGEDCDKECWGKTFPKFIDKLFYEELKQKLEEMK